MKKILLFYILFLPITAQSQPAGDRSVYYHYGTELYAESHFLPSQSADSTDALVMFKFMYDAATFTKVNPLENPGAFRAIPEFEIAFKDSDGIIRNRKRWTDTVYANNYGLTISKRDFIEGYILATLPVDSYTVSVNLLDKYGKKSLERIIDKDNRPDFYHSTYFGKPVFGITPDDKKAYRINPFIIDNKLSFAKENTRMIIPLSFREKYNSFNYLIKSKKSNDRNAWNGNIELSGRAELTEGAYLAPIESGNGKIELIVKSGLETPETDFRQGLLGVEIDENDFVPGRYELVIFAEGTQDTSKQEFRVEWDEMPLSLINPEYAVEVMYYILTDDEYDKLQSVSQAEKFGAIIDFWKQKDPTPKTPYNEAMAEYFRRVDFSFFNYQSLTEKDGAKTPRGKIYILYGPPDNTKTDVKNGNAREIWIYEKIEKQFVFEIIETGSYELTEIKNKL